MKISADRMCWFAELDRPSQSGLICKYAEYPTMAFTVEWTVAVVVVQAAYSILHTPYY